MRKLLCTSRHVLVATSCRSPWRRHREAEWRRRTPLPPAVTAWVDGDMLPCQSGRPRRQWATFLHRNVTICRCYPHKTYSSLPAVIVPNEGSRYWKNNFEMSLLRYLSFCFARLSGVDLQWCLRVVNFGKYHRFLRGYGLHYADQKWQSTMSADAKKMRFISASILSTWMTTYL